MNVHSTAQLATESDYGSDIDDDTWETVLERPESHPLAEVAIEDLDVADSTHASKSRVATLRLPRALDSVAQLGAVLEDKAPTQLQNAPDQTTINGTATEIYPSLPANESSGHEQTSCGDENSHDLPSPLQRFRTPPKKPFSVTDFVSPAWCELQYWYSLTKYGRVRRTPAMKAGTKIHKEKEREVHVEVPIEVQTREDHMGLRLWNVIQGLRTLRSTGLTRELEIFGVLDGEVVIGIIDEVTATCPDEETEIALINAGQAAGASGTGKKKVDTKPVNQRTMQEFFASSLSQNTRLDSSAPVEPITYYLVDIKTRKTKSIPQSGQMKPTRIQLMMYRQILSELSANKIEAERVFQRYNLDQNRSFSDAFIAELAGLDMSSQVSTDEAIQTDPLDEITSHNTLNTLWPLLVQELSKTFPEPDSPATLSPLLTAEYRSSDHGNLLGKKCFGFDAGELDAHLQSTLQWWRGERPAKGVEIEDAWKCGICEFRDGCTWRAEKIDEATQKARLRKRSHAENEA